MRTNTGAPKQLCAAFLALCFLPLAPAAQAQTGTIAGTVTDSTSGQPLPGVNVVIQGTQLGSSTGADGTYAIADLDPGTYTLQASFVGYDTKSVTGVEVAAGDTAQVSVALAPSTVGLEEVVVIGYGEQQQEDVTGSISSISGEELNNVPTPSAINALQGKVAGVQITPSSGAPGADATVRIRGVGTLGDASPLYVVDDVMTNDISFLNPNDIQSVSVLKDASATAIYGSRGANGVVVIQTKSGSADESPTFNLNAYYGLQQVMHKIDLVSAEQYAVLANELAENEGQEDLPFADPSSVTGGVNWQDQVYRTAPIQSYQLSARGGTDRLTYNLSGNYAREEGTLEKSNYERLSLRLNNTYALTDALEIGHNIAFTYRQGIDPNNGVIGAAYRADPTVAPRNDEGAFQDAGARTSAGNPAASLFYYNNGYTGRRLLGNLYAEVDFLDHFTFRSNFGLDLNERETKNFAPEFFVSSAQQNDRSSLTVATLEEGYWQWENTLTYERALGDHQFDLLGGLTAQQFTNNELDGGRFNILGTSPNQWYLNAGNEAGQTNTNTAFDWAILSALARANYSYLDRYLLTASFRVDGSSRFGSENRYGYFPSVAAGWRLSEEPFMQGVDVFDNLKLRASWGITGNDKIGAYPGIAVVTGNLNAVYGDPASLAFGATLSALANPAVKWEETRQTDVGLEAAVFDNRLSVGIDYYRRLTDGVLVQVPIPDYVGVGGLPFINAAEVLNSGFDFSLEWAQSFSNFDYSIGATASTVNNEVQSLGQGKEDIFAGGLVNGVGPTTRTAPGLPIGSFYGYKVAGIYQDEADIERYPSSDTVVPGDLRFEDVNGDGIADAADRTLIGSPIPDFVFGFNLQVGYQGFDLAAQFNGQTGNEIYNAKKAVRFGTENFQTSYLDRWTGPGTSTTEPRLTNAGHNYSPSEYLLEDGSFLKLRNVQLGYTLPTGLLGISRLQNLRVYLNGTNLFTATKYSGYTPEITSGSVIANGLDTGVYPIARTFTVGVNATF